MHGFRPLGPLPIFFQDAGIYLRFWKIKTERVTDRRLILPLVTQARDVTQTRAGDTATADR